MKQRVESDGIGVQIDGDGNTVTLFAGTTRLALDRRHLFSAAPTNERELLLTERRATALVGREDDLADLDSWLASERLIACRCLVGRAGTGKTRLAIELCELMEHKGWIAGFVRHDELQRFFNQQSLADWRWGEKTLIVVDYAAASASILRKWLEVLARRPPGTASLRILLLERHADREIGWWAELARRGGLSGPGPDELLDPADPVVLPSLRHVEERRALLAQTMREAARLHHIDPAPTPPASGVDPDFDHRLADDTINNEPLYLLMAGLVAVTMGAPTALSLSRIDLAMRVAEAERDRLDRLAESAGIDRTLFRHFAACVTLQGSCGLDDVSILVEAERAALGDRTDKRTDDLVQHLADALPLPGTGDIDAVRPDLIGEALLWQHLTANKRSPDAQSVIIERAFARAGLPVVTTIIHTAQDLAEGSAEHASVAWLDRLAGTAKDINTLTAIAAELPESTLAMRERAAEITGRIVATLRNRVVTGADGLPNLAGWLNNLSNRLSDLGRREDALDAIEEAVKIYRALAAARPDVFRLELAGSLINLSNRLSDLGRRQDALAAIEEAANIYRALATARPDDFRPNLALPLNALSNRLSDLGRREDALVAVEEAVDIYRALAAARSDAFRPILAGSLINLSNRLSDLDRRKDALAAIEEAMTIYRALAVARPDVFRPDLALALNNLSNRLSNLGRREDALAAIDEAVTIYRALAEARPDAFRPDLALALNNLSNQLSDLGRHEDARAAIEEAVKSYRSLAAARPAAFRPDLADSLNNLSNRLSDLGRREDALAAIEEAVIIYREFAIARPGRFRPDLALSLINLSNGLSHLARRGDALAAIEEAAEIYRELAAARPEVFRPNLALSLWVLANCLDEIDDLPGSVVMNEEAITALAIPFQKFPVGHEQRMLGMVKTYLNRCEKLGREPDMGVLAPIIALFESLWSKEPES